MASIKISLDTRRPKKDQTLHEFFTEETVLPFPNAGDVVINELLADNVGGSADPNRELENWVELYNTTNAPINLPTQPATRCAYPPAAPSIMPSCACRIPQAG